MNKNRDVLTMQLEKLGIKTEEELLSLLIKYNKYAQDISKSSIQKWKERGAIPAYWLLLIDRIIEENTQSKKDCDAEQLLDIFKRLTTLKKEELMLNAKLIHNRQEQEVAAPLNLSEQCVKEKSS